MVVVSVCSLVWVNVFYCQTAVRESEDKKSNLLCHLQLRGIVAWPFLVEWLVVSDTSHPPW